MVYLSVPQRKRLAEVFCFDNGYACFFAGMIGVTFFGIFLTPVFFYVIRKITRKAGPGGEQGNRI